MARYIAQAGTSVCAFSTYAKAEAWLATKSAPRHRKEIREVYAPGECGERDWNDTSDPRVRQAERDEHDEHENY